MGWLRKIFQVKPKETVEPVIYETPWDAIQGFIHDPRWNVELLEEREGWAKVRFDGITGELFDDPEDQWLHIRFRHPMTEAQRKSELEMYVGWSEHCAQHTLFRWDIDEQAQEYYGDAFALFAGQYDTVECIRSAFNSAKLLTQESNRIALERWYKIYAAGRKQSSVALALWEWFDSPLAPAGTTVDRWSYRETTYWMGSTIGSVKSEQWAYYAVLRFGAGDFMKYMQEGPERQLQLYKMHLQIQRWFPHIRNFVIMTPEQETTNGTQETSMAMLISNGSNADAIFQTCVEEAYEALREYTEWFHFDFNESTAPWFDHSVKKPQKNYVRDFQPRPVP